MDFSALLAPPVLGLGAFLLLMAAWIAHAVGKNAESKRKAQALSEADTAHKQAMAELTADYEDKLSIAKKAAENEIEKLNGAHAAGMSQLKTEQQAALTSMQQGHAAELKRQGDEHGALVRQLNDANIANINAIKQSHQEQMDALGEKHAAGMVAVKEEMENTVRLFKDEHAKTIDMLRAEHEKAVGTLRQEQADKIAEMTRAAERESARMDGIIAGLEGERGALQDLNRELEGKIASLEENIKEAKLQNMFSVSKSGERLIRVVRSVQELASELDETSRTVTGGEYSFFNEIKDQRDKETVLSLTGFSKDVPADPSVHEAEPQAAEAHGETLDHAEAPASPIEPQAEGDDASNREGADESAR